MKLPLTAVLITLVFATSQACLCPVIPGAEPIKYGYVQAGTVVRAKVVKEEIIGDCLFPPCLCTSPPCVPGLDQGKRIYTLRLKKTFKGAAPTTKFTAETTNNAVRCGIQLSVGSVYLLNMSGGGSSYFLWLCQFNTLWSRVSREHKKFMRRCRRPMPPKMCTMLTFLRPA